MVAPHQKWRGEILKKTLLIMGDPMCFSMNDFLGISYGSAKGLCDGLMTQTDSQNGVRCVCGSYDVEGYLALFGVTWAGREYDSIKTMEINVFECRFISLEDRKRGPKYLKSLNDIICERVIIIDKEKIWHCFLL